MKTVKSLLGVDFSVNEGHKISVAQEAADVSGRWARTKGSLKTGLTWSPGILG